jgi:hypothetical protein
MAHSETIMKEKSATSMATAEESCCSAESSASAKDVPVGAICHVEFTVPNLEQAKAFYTSLFGWEFFEFQPTEFYFQTPKNWGPCGCIMQGEPETTGKTTIYANVNDIPSILARATELGAKIITPKTEIPGGHGFFAKFQAPDMNHIGIYSRH